MDLLKKTTFNEELIKINSFYDSSQKALKDTAKMLEKKNLVKNTFTEAILEREKIFPTGLNFIGYGVAIPHTDPEHVIKQSLCINILKTPLEFIEMATDHEKVLVDMIVMLAIKNKEEQVQFLQALMYFFQNEEVINEMISANTTKDAYELFINNFQGVKI